MLELSALDLEEIATALQDQTDYEHQWLIDPKTGEIVFWTADCGIDGTNPVDVDELDLIAIDPVPSRVWFGDMADFAEGISDEVAGARLERSLRGRGAFRHFRDELYRCRPDLVSVWLSFHRARARRRAVGWLVDVQLVDDAAAQQYLAEHPDPVLP